MQSLQRQRQIYIEGLAGKKPVIPISYDALEAKAKTLLSPEAFAYLAGGAGNETTLDNNRKALDLIKIHPRMLSGMDDVDMKHPWQNLTLPAPIMFAPIGVLELAHREGDLALARAAAALDVPMIISSQASYPMEEIAKVLGDRPRLFQLYYSKSKELSQSFIRRAEAIQAKAIVVTLDTTLLGWRNRDLSLGYNPFLLGKGIAQYYSDPVFNALPDPTDQADIKPPMSLTLIKNILQLSARIPGGMIHHLTTGNALKTVRKFTNVFSNPGINWDDIALIRSWTSLPIYLKGILHPDDARKAVTVGVDGIIISNHGGRQIDGSVSSIEVLPAIHHAVEGKAAIWIDSGIRSGSDIYKCLAMGANGVLIGRPMAMALACGGKQGVIDCTNNMIAELELHMALTGCKTIEDISKHHITHPWNNH